MTPGEVMENQPMLDLLWRSCFRWHLWPDQVTGDTTYGTADIILALEQQHILPYVPLPDFAERTGFFGQQAFRYEAERDVYICPNGAELVRLPSGDTEQFQQYQAKASICKACPLKARCTTNVRGRKLSRSVAEEAFERVRGYHQTEPYQKAMRKRQVWVEPLFAEAKEWHGMRRFRLAAAVACQLRSPADCRRAESQAPLEPARLGAAPAAQRGGQPPRRYVAFCSASGVSRSSRQPYDGLLD